MRVGVAVGVRVGVAVAVGVGGRQVRSWRRRHRYLHTPSGHPSVTNIEPAYGFVIRAERILHLYRNALILTQDKPSVNAQHTLLRGVINAPGGIRTPNTQFRRLMLYPVELQAQEQ